MAGSLIFVMYPSKGGNNVTISPRLGSGHVMPLYTSKVGYTLLPGSGLDSGGNYVAHVHCTNCRSWNAGDVNVSSTKQPMIYAVGPGYDQISSNDPTAIIQQHVGYGQFTMNMVAATGPGGVPSDSSVQSGVNVGSESGDAGPGGALHAFFMCGTFIVLFPAGYLFLRVFERLWIHVAFQSFGLFVTFLGTASGIALSIRKDMVRLSNSSSTS